MALFNIGGEIYAIEARCPHASALLSDEGALEGSVLTCARHGSRFDLAQECAVVQGPAVSGPRVWATRVEAGQIFVSPSVMAAEVATDVDTPNAITKPSR